MNQEDFKIMVDNTIERLRQTLIVKGEEYMRNNDRLSNFKQAAGIRRGEIPEGALLGMLIKHWTSIADFIDDLKENKIAPIELWREKLGDNIVYSFLIEACILDRLNVMPIQGKANYSDKTITLSPADHASIMGRLIELKDLSDNCLTEMDRLINNHTRKCLQILGDINAED